MPLRRRKCRPVGQRVEQLALEPQPRQAGRIRACIRFVIDARSSARSSNASFLANSSSTAGTSDRDSFLAVISKVAALPARSLTP